MGRKNTLAQNYQLECHGMLLGVLFIYSMIYGFSNMKRALIIDDDKQMADLISTIVKAQGHQSTVAFDVEGGLHGFRRKAYGLVITDIFMKGIGGIEGIGLIRNIDPDVAIIAISAGYRAMTSIDAIKAARKMGADYGLTKPCESTILADLINHHIKG